MLNKFLNGLARRRHSLRVAKKVYQEVELEKLHGLDYGRGYSSNPFEKTYQQPEEELLSQKALDILNQ